MQKWIAVKERESQRWFIVGEPEWYYEEYYARITDRKRKKRRVQKSYVTPKPEHASPFIEAHKIVEAASKEEAAWLVSNWK